MERSPLFGLGDDDEDDILQGDAYNSFSLVLSTQPFRAYPELVFLKPHTNLFANNSVPSHVASSSNTLLSQIPQIHRLRTPHSPLSPSPDFCSDNHILKDLLSCQFSDSLVSVFIHKIGKTLVLQHVNLFPSYFARSHARLVSGFDLLHPPQKFDANCSSYSFQEQQRLRRFASTQKQHFAMNAHQQQQEQEEKSQPDLLLLRNFHHLSGHTFFNSACDVYEWHVARFSILLQSNLPVYMMHDRRTCSLILRDIAQPRPNRAAVVRWFLDNAMTGTSTLHVCNHVNGIVLGYESWPTRNLLHGGGGGGGQLNCSVLEFLQRYCDEDFAMYWFIKGFKESVAHLWQVDPHTDDQLDPFFRDELLFQNAMLLLSTAAGGGSEAKVEIRYLQKALERLDASAEFAPPGRKRNPLRAALRERLSELLLFDPDTTSLRECFEHLRLALLLVETESRDIRLRLVERGLMIGLTEPVLLAEICDWAEKEVHDQENELLGQAWKERGKAHMRLARLHSSCATTTGRLLEETVSLLENAVRCCPTNREHQFFMGHALNEYGKFLLKTDCPSARAVFQRGAAFFRRCHDVNNLAVLRLNVAQTFKQEGESSLAVQELLETLKEVHAVSRTWTEVVKKELFITLVWEAKGNWEKLNRAMLDFATGPDQVALAHFHMGNAKKAEGEFKFAKRHYQAVLSHSSFASPPVNVVMRIFASIFLAEVDVDSTKFARAKTLVDGLMGSEMEKKEEEEAAVKTKLLTVLCTLLKDEKRYQDAYTVCVEEQHTPRLPWKKLISVLKQTLSL